MKYDQKILEHVKSERKFKPRVVGRYHSSEVYRILKGYVTPNTWMNQEPPDDESTWKMFLGNLTDYKSKQAMEKEGFNCNDKREMKISDECMIVCIPDAYKKGNMHEFKTLTTDKDGNLRLVADIRNPHPAHRMQVECYLRAFDENEIFISYLQLLPRDSKTFKYIRDDKLWKTIKTKVLEFHEEIKRIHG